MNFLVFCSSVGFIFTERKIQVGLYIYFLWICIFSGQSITIMLLIRPLTLASFPCSALPYTNEKSGAKLSCVLFFSIIIIILFLLRGKMQVGLSSIFSGFVYFSASPSK